MKANEHQVNIGLKRQLWTEKDITRSITLYSASAGAYKLLKKQNFPIPSVRTLQSWAEKLEIKKKENL